MKASNGLAFELTEATNIDQFEKIDQWLKKL
jgi:hypothetical protein